LFADEYIVDPLDIRFDPERGKRVVCCDAGRKRYQRKIPHVESWPKHDAEKQSGVFFRNPGPTVATASGGLLSRDDAQAFGGSDACLVASFVVRGTERIEIKRR